MPSEPREVVGRDQGVSWDEDGEPHPTVDEPRRLKIRGPENALHLRDPTALAFDHTCSR